MIKYSLRGTIFNEIFGQIYIYKSIHVKAAEIAHSRPNFRSIAIGYTARAKRPPLLISIRAQSDKSTRVHSNTVRRQVASRAVHVAKVHGGPAVHNRAAEPRARASRAARALAIARERAWAGCERPTGL